MSLPRCRFAWDPRLEDGTDAVRRYPKTEAGVEPFPARRGWIAFSSVRMLRQRFCEGWEHVPAPARARFFLVLAVGFALNAALMGALVAGARALEARGALAWEAGLLQWIAAHVPLSFGYAVVVQGLANPFLLVTLLVTAAAGAVWVGKPMRALAFVAAFFLLDPVILLGWELWVRPRPEVIAGGLASPGGLNAFPSGHLAQATALYGLLFALWIRASSSALERGAALLGLASVLALIAVARLRIGVHWPTDMVAGFIIGATWLAVVLLALARAGENQAVASRGGHAHAALAPEPNASGGSTGDAGRNLRARRGYHTG